MKIEDGKTYRTRNGAKMCIRRELHLPAHLPWYGTDDNGWGYVYYAGGERSPGTLDEYDIIAEWVDEKETELKIEEGKFYRRADGKKAGPMGPLGDSGKWRDPVSTYYYDDDGFWIAGVNSDLTLIAEWTDDANLGAAEALSEPEPSVDVKSAILQEAGNIVNGARRSAYGTPEDNFARIARFWQAYFENTGRTVTITAADVSPMMRLLKEARLCESPTHRDSFVDLIGYALTGAEVNGVSAK